MKKATELATLCDCQVAVLIFNGENLHQFASIEMEEMWQRWKKFDGPFEALSSEDVSLCSC